jgi:hypothetical protein
LERGNGSHIDYVVYDGAAREIIAGPPQSLNDGTHGARASQPLHQLVRNVPSIERWED